MQELNLKEYEPFRPDEYSGTDSKEQRIYDLAKKMNEIINYLNTIKIEDIL